MPVASAATVASHGANSSAKSRKRHERRIVKDVTSGHWRGQRGMGDGERDIDHASHVFRDERKCYERGEQITVPCSPFPAHRSSFFAQPPERVVWQLIPTFWEIPQAANDAIVGAFANQ